MRVLVACEYSGIVRDAFLKKGHDAVSCDLLPTESPGPHYQGDIQDILYEEWDLIIAFPPCTHLCILGARWFKEKQADGRQQQGIDFFMLFANHPCEKIAIENPIGIMSRIYRKPDQIIQPWQYGHKSRKTTCLWLKGLPKIKPTKIMRPELYTTKSGASFSRDFLFDENGKWESFGGQGKKRSKTYQGIADAMADTYGVVPYRKGLLF